MPDTEGAGCWLQVVSELCSRGQQNILFLYDDGLKVLAEAAEASFLHGRFQTCIVHVIRASCRYVAWKDRKASCEAMREVTTAIFLKIAQTVRGLGAK